MDITPSSSALIASRIHGVEGYSLIDIPDMSGYFDFVVYAHDRLVISTDLSTLPIEWGIPSGQEISNTVFCMSQIGGLLWMRIIDTRVGGVMQTLVIRRGRISTYILRGMTYYVLIYETPSGEKGCFTNFLIDDTIFRTIWADGAFSVYSRLTDSVIYRATYDPEDLTEEISPRTAERHTTEVSQENLFFFLVRDPLISDEEHSMLLSHLDSLSMITIDHLSESLVMISTPPDSSQDLDRLIGWIGSHQCLIESRLPYQSGYTTISEAQDTQIDLPETFEISDDIGRYDPRWTMTRHRLMELSYMRDLLQHRIGQLSGAISEMNALDSPHLQLQRELSSMTLVDLISTHDRYEEHFSTLVRLIREKISFK